MNAISGSGGTSAAAQVYTTAAVQRLRPVTSNADRAALEQAAATSAPAVDRYEASASTPAVPSVTYGRTGWGGQSAPAAQGAPVVPVDRDGDGDGH